MEDVKLLHEFSEDCWDHISLFWLGPEEVTLWKALFALDCSVVVVVVVEDEEDCIDEDVDLSKDILDFYHFAFGAF